MTRAVAIAVACAVAVVAVAACVVGGRVTVDHNVIVTCEWGGR